MLCCKRRRCFEIERKWRAVIAWRRTRQEEGRRVSRDFVKYDVGALGNTICERVPESPSFVGVTITDEDDSRTFGLEFGTFRFIGKDISKCTKGSVMRDAGFRFEP